MSTLRPASNGDPIKTRKIDKIKQKLVEMLRESFQHLKHVLNQSTTMYTGEIGFKLSNFRLPWSTLDGDLRRKGYIIVNWPQGVSRDRWPQCGCGLDDALFVDDIRFVPCGEGTFLST